MKLIASDNSPCPTITHCALDRLQVCVPTHWSTGQTLEFAESKWSCITNYHWQIHSEHQACDIQSGFTHHNLQIQPNEEITHPHSETSLTANDEPIIRARVILNVDHAHSESLLQTAESIQLLADYLQLKAAAIKAAQNNQLAEARKHEAQAEQLNSQLLAQFTGTLIFI